MTFEFLTVVMLFLANKKSAPDSMGACVAGSDSAPPPTLIKLLASFIANYAFVFVITLPLILQTLHQASVSANRKQLLSWDEYA